MGTINLEKYSTYLLLVFIFLSSSCSPSKIGKPTHTPQVHIVEILASQYEPSVLTIQSGDVVKWINRDTAPHQLAGFFGEKLQTGILSQGKSYSRVIKVSTSYACVIHPEMLGSVIVR